jgi:pimeloyl-ACP methyl ester carboxylesterase
MFLETNGVRLFYETSGSGPALILLHGNGETHRIFDTAVETLRQHFTVYAIDTRGHGSSSPAGEFHYADMADDVYGFITQLGLERPALYGFSDGGIVGLLLAIRHPGLLSALVVSGANTRPSGVKRRWLCLFRLMHAFKRSPLLALMLTEPDITADMLKSIATPTHITAGSRDMIRPRHTQLLHSSIPGSTLKIFRGETHSSYIVNSDKIAEYLIERLAK